MASIQCKMCGGVVELPAGVTSGECPYCGCLTTFPRLPDIQREQLYTRAEHFRQINDFDKAVSSYEEIVKQDPEDPEAYWGLLLSRFGIEYVEDPVSHERIPTCHRVQFDSILADSDYKSVLQYAGGFDRDIYENEAKRIAEIQKSILAISSQEKPYDVFICYKETTEGGSRTKDSALAQDIYYQLTNEGYKVFFSRITLEDKLGQQYEPYIFAALNSAKVMLVIGSKKEYFEAVWVKNEWSRFLALMKKDRSRLLIPCYRDMDVYDIPQELSMFQSQDMNKIGFIQDLLRGVKKILNAPSKETSQQNTSATEKLFKRITLFLQDHDWDSALSYCERILDEEPENADAYFYKFLAKNKLDSKQDAVETNVKLAIDADFQKALRFAPEKYNQILQEQQDIYQASNYAMAVDYMEHQQYQAAINLFSQNAEYRDSKEKLMECYYYMAMLNMQNQSYELAIELFQRVPQYYREAAEQINECYYRMALWSMQTHHYVHAEEFFRQCPGYRDADELIEQCRLREANDKCNEHTIMCIIASAIVMGVISILLIIVCG